MFGNSLTNFSLRRFSFCKTLTKTLSSLAITRFLIVLCLHNNAMSTISSCQEYTDINVSVKFCIIWVQSLEQSAVYCAAIVSHNEHSDGRFSDSDDSIRRIVVFLRVRCQISLLAYVLRPLRHPSEQMRRIRMDGEMLTVSFTSESSYHNSCGHAHDSIS